MSRWGLAVVVASAVASGCRTTGAMAQPPIFRPGPPGEPGLVVSAAAAADLSGVRHTAADIQFMRDMIGHHAQAIEMTDLVAARGTRADVRLLAQRIAESQADEIQMMRTWLTARGAALPDDHAHQAPGAPTMPGMLTRVEMDRLRAATSAAFDRLFLELMIKHHEGALMMVRTLFATDGAGQEPDIYTFASDVVADQEIEIRRMRGMLYVP